MSHPKILYKYRDWCNVLHKQIVTEGKLYLASPRDFEDVFDCNIPEKFPEGKRELNNLFLNKAKNEHPLWSRQEKREYARYWSKRSPLANPTLKNKTLEYIRQEDYDSFGILSMTEDCNNDEMWQKYANEHKGFCVGLDAAQLENHTSGSGRINYVEKLPILDFANDSIKTKVLTNILYKEDKWSFEKEYRLFKRWDHRVRTEERIIKIPDNCIIEIILGKNMSDQNKEEIKELVRNRHPHTTIIEK